MAAGDDVECVNIGDEEYNYEALIIGVKERRSVVSVPNGEKRKSGHVYEKILAANIDLFIVVDSVTQPEIQYPFIDRCLIIGQREGDKTSVLCVNKIDLVDDIPAEVKEYEICVDHLLLISAKT